MRKFTLLAVLSLMILAGCSPQTLTATPAELPTQAVAQPSEAPIEVPTEAVAEIPTQEPVEASGQQEFNIVPGESTVTYEVGETFFNQNNRFNIAIGTTTQISGKITLDPADPQSTSISTIEVDISQFTSDSNRRDSTIRDRFLKSGRFPIATFVPTRIEGLPESYTDGQPLKLTVSGDLTVHDVTKPAIFDVQVTLVNNELQGSASTTILMSDFGVGPIVMAGILGTEDQVKINMAFVAR